MDTPINLKEQYTASCGLTQSQLSLWMGQQLNPEAPLYNMTLTFDLKGTIQMDHFQLAFQQLVQQSDAMRTVFAMEEEEPVQKVVDDLPFTLNILDWSNAARTDEEVEQWLQQRSEQLFDLSSCLFDSVLIKRSNNQYLWFLNQHHLITDAWAVTLQYRALADYYQLSIEGRLHEAESLPLFRQYIDYEKVARPDQEAAKTYWTQRASEAPAPLHLYGNNKLMVPSRSERVMLDLGVERSNQLRALTKETDLRSWTQHLSLFNIFASTLFAFLYRVSGQEKLAIGTPAHNRSTTEFKNTPGVFIEVFPLFAAIQKGESFGSLIQRIRNESNYFLRHAQSGTGSPELSRSFNVVLNYINVAFSDFNNIPMQSTWVHPNHCDPGHHLRLQVHDFDASGSIQLHFDLNEAVFPEHLRSLVPGHFLNLLDAFIQDRSQSIDQIRLVSEKGFEKIANHLNEQDTFDFDYASISNLFEKQVEQNPEATAIQFGQQKISYQDLNQKANQLARQLMDQGIAAEQKVAIYLTRSPELLISILACLKVGATYIPIPSNYPAGRVEEMVADAQASLLISSQKLEAKLNAVSTPVFQLNQHTSALAAQPKENLGAHHSAEALAYLMYTSGSTGKAKGVMISNRALSHYIQWAARKYANIAQPAVPLFTSIGFDLTVTSLFIPLVSGGCSVIYEEVLDGPDLALFQVIEDNAVDLIKLTPAHLALLKGMNLSDSRIKTMVLGGENLKTGLAREMDNAFGHQVQIFNEYGPTEATVGCVIHQFDTATDVQGSVPIGQAIANTQVYVLDDHLNPVPSGVIGELYIAGMGLANGYWQQDELSNQQFIDNPFQSGTKMYRSGDLVRSNENGLLEFLGRKDEQVKIRGRRIEFGEIETALNQYPAIQTCVVDLRERKQQTDQVVNCKSCGLPSNYPGTKFDEQGVCHLCNSFESYQQKVQKYFKVPAELLALFEEARRKEQGEYDCLLLLSGGKDSTYALGQLIEMGLKVLTFTLDNGYISEQAKANIRRVVKELGVDHVFGETPAMNEIFVDSLQRHCNVCDGCFKTIYTLSMKIALEKKIPFIITGLSRGQFFETRLTEELFVDEKLDVDQIDDIILNARKAYHRVDDAVKRLMDVSVFDNDEVFEKVRFLDYYRYTDVTLDEMYDYLDNRLPWSRPTDTGRSTNCLINQAGIFVHKKERGYSNYAFPYSWDVRIGVKTRDASLEEINEVIDETEVQRILDEIGYTQATKENASEKHLVAYYVADDTIDEMDLNQHLSGILPDYMIPVQFIQMDKIPLSNNGKVDRGALPKPDGIRPMLSVGYVAPRTDIEEMLTEIWSDVLHIDKIGVYDKFLHLGGHSLTAIRLTSRINEAMELELPLNLIFSKPTIAAYAEHVKTTIEQLLSEMNDS